MHSAAAGAIRASMYFDAAGRAQEARTWGGLAVVGPAAMDRVESSLDELKKRSPTLLQPETGELKGKDMSDVEIIRALDLLHGQPVYFWGRELAGEDDPVMVAAREEQIATLERLSPNRARADWDRVVEKRDRLVGYLRGIRKPVNLHKFVSICIHLPRLVDHLGSLGVASQLVDMQVVVDNENFPQPPECAWGLKWFVASQLQGAGMPPRLNGNAPFEEAHEGSVRVVVDRDSSRSAGIQYVDILTHGVVRRLPGFVL